MAQNSFEQALEAVAGALANEEKVLVTTHIKPDGDALGSLIAMHLALLAAGKDSVMYISETNRIAPEYRFLKRLDEVHYGTPPEDWRQRALCAVDCGNPERVGNDELVKGAPRLINIDHHSDNPRYGDLNLVAGGASSTAEIIFFILRKMGIDIDAEIAEALYTGILVDSGRFQYGSTSATTFQVAAELMNAGIDHTRIFHNVYESVPLAKSRLMCRMFDNLTIACDGLLAIGLLELSDFEAAGAGTELTDGLVNNLRELEGVQMAALIYELKPEEGGSRLFRVSLRSTSEKIDMQRIAKEKSGGGHKQAAGFTATDPPDDIISFLCARAEQSLSD